MEPQSVAVAQAEGRGEVLLLPLPLPDVQALGEAPAVYDGQLLALGLLEDARLYVPGRVALVQAVGEGLGVGEREEQTVAEAQWLAEAQPVKDAEGEAAPLSVAL